MQCTPSTVIHALHPLPITHDGVTLQPVTFGHCLLLDRLVPQALRFEQLEGGSLWLALYILSRPQQATVDVISGWNITEAVESWVSSLSSPDSAVLSVIVRSQLIAAFAPLAETEMPDYLRGDVETVVQIQSGCGLGWVLLRLSELCDRMPIAEALDFRVSTALALLAAREIRQGCKWAQPSYEDIDRIEAEDAEQVTNG